MQLGPGSIVRTASGGHKVAAHFRANNRHRGYIITDTGDHLWDDEVDIQFFVPPTFEPPPEKPPGGGLLSRLFRRTKR